MNFRNIKEGDTIRFKEKSDSPEFAQTLYGTVIGVTVHNGKNRFRVEHGGHIYMVHQDQVVSR